MPARLRLFLVPPFPAWLFSLTLVMVCAPVLGQDVRVAEPSETGGVALVPKDAPNGGISEAEPLPPGTRVVVLSAEERKAHSLDNLGVPRDKLANLARGIIEAGDEEVLTATGQTEAYAKTSQGRIYYVLAQAPKGDLYESRVAVTGQGFQPGFDAVYSGNMAMGLVPEAAQETMARVFAPTEEELETLKAARQDSIEQARTDSIVRADSLVGARAGSDSWGWLAIGAGLLGLVAGLGGIVHLWRTRNQSGQQHPKHPTSLNHAPVPGSGNQPRSFLTHSNDDRIRLVRSGEGASSEELRAMERDELAGRLHHSEREIKKLSDELERVKSERDEHKAKAARAVSPVQPQSRPQRSTQPPAPPAAPPEKKVSDAFVKWCKSGHAMIDRCHVFSGRLRDGVPDAEVEVVLRDADAIRTVFTDDAKDPVEYWRITLGSESWLYPQPRRGGFRELAPCFDGDADPSTLTRIEPAKLDREGSRFVLQRRGRVG